MTTGLVTPFRTTSKWSAKNSAPVRQVMASPPTPTLTASHTLASYRWLPPALDPYRGGTQFLYTRAGGFGMGTNYPDTFTAGFSSVNYNSFKIANAYAVSFFHTGSSFEIAMKSVGQAILLKVDDQYVSLTPTTATNSGSTSYWHFNFGSVATRRIEFISSGYGGFQGVYVNPTDSVEPATVRGPRVIVPGDSFSEGSGASGEGANNWVQIFSDMMGWDDVWPSGVGSAGWIASGTYNITIPQRLATDVIPFNPDIVLFAGGTNDVGATYSQIYAAATSALLQLRAALPNALLVNIGPLWRSGPGYTTPATLYTGAAAGLRDAFKAVDGFSFSPLEMPLPEGFAQPNLTVAEDAAAGAPTIRLSGEAVSEMTYALPDGSRFYPKSIAGGSNIATLDGSLANAATAGQPITVVGNSLWTGGGNSGAQTGYGNADWAVSGDSTHPTDAGHLVIANFVAKELSRLLATS